MSDEPIPLPVPKKPMIHKIDVTDTFNDVIVDLVEQKEKGRVLPPNLEVLDMKFQLIWEHLAAIAQRAMDIDDTFIQSRLFALGVLKEVENPSPLILPPDKGIIR